MGKRKHCDKDGCKQPGTNDRPYCPEHACKISWCRAPRFYDEKGYCWQHHHEWKQYSEPDPITPEWLEESSLWPSIASPDVYTSLRTPVATLPYQSKACNWVVVERIPSMAFPGKHSWTVRIAQDNSTKKPITIDVAWFARKRDVLNALRLLCLHPKGENG